MIYVVYGYEPYGEGGWNIAAFETKELAEKKVRELEKKDRDFYYRVQELTYYKNN